MGCWGGQGGETCGYTRESPSQATPCTPGCVQLLPSAPSVLEQVTAASPQKETPTISSPFPEPPVTTVCFLVAYSGRFLEMESDIMWPVRLASYHVFRARAGGSALMLCPFPARSPSLSLSPPGSWCWSCAALSRFCLLALPDTVLGMGHWFQSRLCVCPCVCPALGTAGSTHTLGRCV